jgi:hypothetical protein
MVDTTHLFFVLEGRERVFGVYIQVTFFWGSTKVPMVSSVMPFRILDHLETIYGNMFNTLTLLT